MRDLNRILAGHRRRGNIDLLDIVHDVIAGNDVIGRMEAIQRIGVKHRPAGPIDAEVQVVDQYGRAYIKSVLRGSGRIRPAQGGAYRVHTVPGEGIRLIRLRLAHAVLHHVKGSGVVRLGFDLVRRHFRIHQPPAVTVIRPGVAQIMQRMNDETLEHARSHILAGKPVAVIVHKQ
ncbi:MAG: hypothetical protein BWY09_00764 [Candidatus Hydrogenedentes bacterium ADurb.Bin179]|nr:MAG: hypothetical protein BWY09_00764 [Candidatus Hydrogenedentes bacterium ADurb.Bin179]